MRIATDHALTLTRSCSSHILIVLNHIYITDGEDGAGAAAPTAKGAKVVASSGGGPQQLQHQL